MKRNYDDPVYKEWRRKVYARDGHKCQMPGCKNKTKIQAHHIRRWVDSPSLRYDVSNGISLCRGCHKSISKAENAYISLFMDIVRRNTNAKH